MEQDKFLDPECMDVHYELKKLNAPSPAVEAASDPTVDVNFLANEESPGTS